jgi:hypothetical protein
MQTSVMIIFWDNAAKPIVGSVSFEAIKGPFQHPTKINTTHGVWQKQQRRAISSNCSKKSMSLCPFSGVGE